MSSVKIMFVIQTSCLVHGTFKCFIVKSDPVERYVLSGISAINFLFYLLALPMICLPSNIGLVVSKSRLIPQRRCVMHDTYMFMIAHILQLSFSTETGIETGFK